MRWRGDREGVHAGKGESRTQHWVKIGIGGWAHAGHAGWYKPRYPVTFKREEVTSRQVFPIFVKKISQGKRQQWGSARGGNKLERPKEDVKRFWRRESNTRKRRKGKRAVVDSWEKRLRSVSLPQYSRHKRMMKGEREKIYV